jgi:hypothetical protein
MPIGRGEKVGHRHHLLGMGKRRGADKKCLAQVNPDSNSLLLALAI